jgi:hypothetical protein
MNTMHESVDLIVFSFEIEAYEKIYRKHIERYSEDKIFRVMKKSGEKTLNQGAHTCQQDDGDYHIHYSSPHGIFLLPITNRLIDKHFQLNNYLITGRKRKISRS